MTAAGQERETHTKAVPSMMPDNVDDESVIIIGDVDDFNQSSDNLSIPSTDADKSIIVTYSKKAEVLPHARCDCTSNIFSPAENERSCPLNINSAFCEQCYCYVCDGLASQCKYWTTLGIFHCNAHNKSSFWKEARNLASNGTLAMFHLNAKLIDADIRDAGKLLETFLMTLKPLYYQYFIGTQEPGNACPCTCHACEASNLPVSSCQFCNLHHFTVKEHFYQPVFSAVQSFLNVLGSLGPSGQLVAMLGVAKEIMLHEEMPTTSSVMGSRWTNLLKPAVVHLMELIQSKARIIQVEHKLPPALLKGLKSFFSGLFFPSHCICFLKSMFIIGWDEPMLSSVMRGQNISGIFRIKGKRKLLHENFDVVMARKNKLVQEEKYQELIRYLKVVSTDNRNGLQKLRSEIPVYLCKMNKLFDALRWMASSPMCTSSLPPTVIKTMIVNASELIHDTAAPASREKASLFLSLALRIFFLNEDLKNDINSLVMLVKLLCTPPTPAGTKCAHIKALGCPPPELFEKSHAIVEDLTKVNGHIPNIPCDFSSLAGCVVIATNVIVQNFSLQLLRPENFWNLLLSYGPNMWAVEFLLSSVHLNWTFVGDLQNLAYHEGIVERLAVQHLEQMCALADLFRKVDHAEFNYLGIYFSSLIFFFMMRRNVSTEPEKKIVKNWMASTVIPTLVRLNTKESIELQKAVCLFFFNHPS
ncbi:uncharacterized protein LOC116954137 isoform X1 [Petromyzon marinus]|uniref:uncharacterized protein LOC116954137 isoform X1 n=1 Tax=Petromyzon marinus TaxID=7757 RepID=UPI003F70BFAB